MWLGQANKCWRGSLVPVTETPSHSEEFIMDKDVAHHRARVCGLEYAVRAEIRTPDDPELLAELGHLRAAGVRDRARKLLAELPELTPEHLAGLPKCSGRIEEAVNK